jgi:hypothetical protein
MAVNAGDRGKNKDAAGPSNTRYMLLGELKLTKNTIRENMVKAIIC